ncbi:hypothetical protein [Microvirga sp. P5_D2]
MLINLHRLNTKNVGDLVCAPANYYSNQGGFSSADILGWRSSETPLVEDRKRWKETFAEAKGFVVGGGGLLHISFFEPALKYLFENKRPEQKVVLWGAGHNDWQVNDWRTLKFPLDLNHYPFDLIGVRDFNQPYAWVPCVSCMSPLLEKRHALKREIGLYVHTGTLKNESFRKKLPSDIEILSNDSTFEEAIEFIGSTKLLLTDSYHGMYWATLLERKVIAFPSSSKFYDTKYPAPLCTPVDWMKFERMAMTYPEAYSECQETNNVFADQAFNLLS